MVIPRRRNARPTACDGSTSSRGSPASNARSVNGDFASGLRRKMYAVRAQHSHSPLESPTRYLHIGAAFDRSPPSEARHACCSPVLPPSLRLASIEDPTRGCSARPLSSTGVAPLLWYYGPIRQPSRRCVRSAVPLRSRYSCCETSMAFPSSVMRPFPGMPCSPTPADSPARSPYNPRLLLPSRMRSRSASARFFLRGSIASLALGPVGRSVYASPCSLPRTAQDSIPAGWLGPGGEGISPSGYMRLRLGAPSAKNPTEGL